MKYSVATISLPTLSPDDVIQEVSAAGYTGVEWKFGEAPHAMNSSASFFLQNNKSTLTPGVTNWGRLHRMCERQGLTIVGLGPYLRIGDRDSLREVLNVAAALGAPQVRLQAARTSVQDTFDFHELFRNTVDYLAVAEEMARDRGVRVVVEMHHHTVAPSAALAHSLVSRFDPEVIGVIYDVGNTVWEGSENMRIAFSILGPYLHHVHLKNVAAMSVVNSETVPNNTVWKYTWSALDEGFVDVRSTLRLLTEVGYDGWISLEDLSTVRDPVGTLRHNAAFLQALPEARWSAA